jgi:hypothetical protein
MATASKRGGIKTGRLCGDDDDHTGSSLRDSNVGSEK